MKLIVETERLLVVEAELEDSKFFFELLNSPNWLEFIGDRGIKTEKHAEAYIQSSLISSYENNGYGLFKMVLRQSLEPIGICGFVKRDYLEHPDIGFAILPQFEGKGFVFEACNSLLIYGKEILSLHPILAITTEKNVRSQALLSKIGLNSSGIIKPNKEEFLLYST
ncbi:GNAT family N-acetyltransferase [uncultured Allomuricauda sp.]|uniref:GNAT family N-acetyltransferase n=1 Tax=Flagellimonas sp. W118 TaxID=3410791 RepID=UPI002614FC93|nr:GNAT family N-acetyltransferase [uncultured Allomuricauda sp.]